MSSSPGNSSPSDNYNFKGAENIAVWVWVVAAVITVLIHVVVIWAIWRCYKSRRDRDRQFEIARSNQPLTVMAYPNAAPVPGQLYTLPHPQHIQQYPPGGKYVEPSMPTVPAGGYVEPSAPYHQQPMQPYPPPAAAPAPPAYGGAPPQQQQQQQQTAPGEKERPSWLDNNQGGSGSGRLFPGQGQGGQQ
ncbi:hypothetical protein HDU96_000723 [Phlyctochytrium bullatum]|nr:hypothetical protein HDU96_000723 [Phlyctochytrium bullatum]